MASPGAAGTGRHHSVWARSCATASDLLGAEVTVPSDWRDVKTYAAISVGFD